MGCGVGVRGDVFDADFEVDEAEMKMTWDVRW